MRGASILVALVVAAALIVAIYLGNDGATARQDSAAQAQVQVAQQDAYARVEVARYDAEARQEIARQETQRAHIWSGVAPLVAIVGGLTLIAGIILWWRGRIVYAQVTRAPLLPAPPPQVIAIAQARGGEPVLVDGLWYVKRGDTLIARINQLEVRS